MQRALLRLASAIALALGSSMALGTFAIAETWPDHPIKLIVPTGPGAATDVMARLMAEDVGRRLGQVMVVENRAGAQGMPAHQAAATAAPDGYTFLFTNTSGLAGNPVTFKKLPYDPASDFAAVATVINLGPHMISVNSALPVRTMAELQAYAKANPGKLSYAADATAGSAVIVGRLVNKRAGLGMAEVPYRTAAQMVQDVASGIVPVVSSSIAVVTPFYQTGQIRPVAVSSAKRFPTMPDVQAMNETLPGVVIDGWFVVVAPKGTPAPIIARVNTAIGAYLEGADVRRRLLDIGLGTDGAGTPEETAAMIAREQALWRSLAAELGIVPQ